jgi:coenzyme F420-reducing hydrogenase delta subunit
VGCHPGDCHYKEGNYRARNRVALTRSLLGQLGIEPDRLRLDWAGAAEGGRFQQIVESMYTELTARPALELPGAEPPLPSTPKLLTFVCHWCSHGAADQAGAMKLEQPAGVRLVRVMCSGRVDAALILEGFRSGADGVLVMGCHPGDCHYKEGNYKARNRVTLTRSLLTQFGIEPERLRIDWAGAAEGARFQQIVESTYADLLARGPLARPVGALPEVAP